MKIEHKDMNIFHLTCGSVISTTETDYLIIKTEEDEPALLDLSDFEAYYCSLLTDLIDQIVTPAQLKKLIENFTGETEEYKAFYSTHTTKLILGGN